MILLALRDVRVRIRSVSRSADSPPTAEATGPSGSTEGAVADPPGGSPPPRPSDSSGIVFTVTLVALVGFALFGRRIFAGLFTDDGVRTWATMFVGVVVQAIPFLVLGVLLSAALTAFVPPSFFAGRCRSIRRSPYRWRARRE
jgi:hypothetical protein